MVANKSLAEYNLTQEPILNRKKEQLAEKHREAVQLLQTVNDLKNDLASKSGKIQPDALYTLLQVLHKEKFYFWSLENIQEVRSCVVEICVKLIYQSSCCS